MFCLNKENVFHVYSKTLNKAFKNKIQYRTIYTNIKSQDILDNNVMNTFISSFINRINKKNIHFLYPNEINKIMIPYNMISFLNDSLISKKENKKINRNFISYVLKKNITLRDDINLVNSDTIYEYSADYNNNRMPDIYGCYNNVFLSDNFHQEIDFSHKYVETFYKSHFMEIIENVMTNHIDRINENYNSRFFIESIHIKEILIKVYEIIYMAIEDIYNQIDIQYSANDALYDDLSYHTDSFLNFIIDKNIGDFIFDLYFIFYMQKYYYDSDSDIDTDTDTDNQFYNFFVLTIQVMRTKKDIKFFIKIQINADNTYDKVNLIIEYNQENKDTVQVFCDIDDEITEKEFEDFHIINASENENYVGLLNEIDNILSKSILKKININFLNRLNS